ncbi:MAG TPA: response regulator [Thermoanaerobaculia bacterium]
MPEKSATSRKWRAGLLRAGQAAAILTLATGVNGTLAAMFPRYEPIYVYLIAITLVAWLSSALLGVTAAVVAVIVYDWMFAPVRVVPSMSFVIPLTIAVATAIAARAIRAPLAQRPILPQPSPPPLLPAIDHGGQAPSPVEEDRRGAYPPQAVVQDERVPELEAQLARARSQAENEARLRNEASAAAKAREVAFANEIEAMQERLADQGTRSVSAKRDYDALLKRVTDTDARVAALQQGLEVAQRRANEEHARAAEEAKHREELEVAGHEALQKAVSDLTAKYEAKLLEAQQRRDLLTKRFEVAQKELNDMRARFDREATQRPQSETADKLQKGVADLTAKHESALAEAKKRADSAQTKADALQRELDRTLASLSDEHARADREAKLRGQLEAAARATLNRTAGVSAEHQREASEARETARMAEERAAALASEIEQLRTAAEEARTSFGKQLESAKESVERERAKLTAELSATREVLESARKDVEVERQRANEIQALNEKLRRMAADHENAIGDSLLARESAKAEVRTMTQKLHELQRAADEERRHAAEEKAARERLDAEWSEKLQKIVTHIAEDHETDIGEALMAREAARAEARTFAARVTTLQQRLEEEREKFRQATERWQQERTTLVAQAGEQTIRRPTFPPTVEQPLPTTTQTKTERPHVILVVHSDAGVRAMAKHSLQQAGYSVLTAADGLEGLRTATQQKPDVVLAEAVMPKMNARELVQLLKSRRETADVKIVLVSGSGEMERGADFRADDVVRSPIDFNDLRTVLANVLSRRGVTS